MKRDSLWLIAAAVCALSTVACGGDNTTGVGAMSPRVERDPMQLREAIAFFTYQFGATGNLAVMNSDGSGRQPIPGGERGFEPSISPDGRRIVFSRVTSPGTSDLFIMNVDGTGLRTLVQGLVFNGQPVWSPNGCQIAFHSQRTGSTGPYPRISIINADGSGQRQVTPEVGENDFAFDEGASFSPDGTRLIFTRNLVLNVINVDGTGMTPLPNEDMAQDPAWSPDGQRIAYWSIDPPGDIHVRNADGTNLVRVTQTPDEFESWPRWSPDGRRIVFVGGASDQAIIKTINVDGTGSAALTPPGVNDYMPDWTPRHSSTAQCNPGVQIEVDPLSVRLAPGDTRQFTATVRATNGTVIDHAPVQWSSTNPSVVTVTPSGLATGVATGSAELLATFGGVANRATVVVRNPVVLRNTIVYATLEFGVSELAKVQPDGSGRQRLTTDQFGYFSPAISPDGRRIAFSTFGGIYTIDADGAGRALIVARSFGDGSPAWSPDGARIAFRSWNNTPLGSASRIFVVNVDGTGLRQLSPDDPDPGSNDYLDDSPAWSPDGSHIAFSRAGELYVINVDGTGLTMVSSPDGAEMPAWSPDGTKLVYTSWKTIHSVYVSNADGSNAVPLTNEVFLASNPRWSPDGRGLVFCQLYLRLFTINADGTGVNQLSANPNASECTSSWSPLP